MSHSYTNTNTNTNNNNKKAIISLLFASSMGMTAVTAWTSSPLLHTVTHTSFTSLSTPVITSTSTSTSTSSTALSMALDYNDPVVATEFANVQPLTYEEVEEELMASGVRGSPDMNEMDLKLMLVELRMRMSGKMPDQKPKEEKKPSTYSTKYEEALWEKPFFKELIDGLKSKGDHNSQNVAAEYLNNPDVATQRYGKDYKGLLRKIDAALSMKKEVTSPIITFKGFPANMGDMGCKMTLEALGEIVEFECTESDDFPILEGRVEFEDIETAKKAIDQYDGMDMGMGQALEIISV